MAQFDNPFALLGDEDDGAGVSAIIDRIAAEKEAAQKDEAAADQKKSAAVADQKKTAVKQQKPVYDSENGRVRGRGGRGQSRGGRGGRVYNGGRGDLGNGRQFNGYNDNYQYQHHRNYQRQNSEGLENGTAVQETGHNVSVSRNENGNNNGGRGYGRPRGEFTDGERPRFRGRYGGSNGGNDRRKQLENKNKEEHYADNANTANNGHGASGRELHVNALPKIVEPEKVLSEQEKKQLEDEEHVKKERRERFMKEMEEDAKKLTLSQFEEKQQERRKELEEKLKKYAGENRTPAEGLKPEERRVVLEKKYEGEPVVFRKEKMEENFSTKPKSEKENLKIRDSLGKEEKIRKAKLIPNFQFPKRERNSNSSGNGQESGLQFQKPASGSGNGSKRSQDSGNGSDYRRGLAGRLPEPEPKAAVAAPKQAPKIEDGGQFPHLSKSLLIK